MRKIKFRTWDRVSEELVAVKTLDFEHQKGAVCAVDYSDINGDLEGEWELEQYTGLRDKNGKEIYEGDIVETVENDGFEYLNYEIMPVFYSKIQAGFVRRSSNGMEFRLWNSDYMGYEYEVIGNIHENPELLEEENND